jgi:hypothetical protein
MEHLVIVKDAVTFRRRLLRNHERDSNFGVSVQGVHPNA